MSRNKILLTAVSSGSGKTTITCGILRALQRRGLRLVSFKCGPDYIDPMFHEQVLHVPSRNLDPFFADEETLHFLYEKHSAGADLAVVEGVMGYYDGIGGTDTAGSSYELAKRLGLPAVLIVPCGGLSGSVAAIVKGFMSYKTPSHIRGVILNQVSGALYPGLKALIERECGVKVLGFLPRLKEFKLESRHLGLVTPEETKNLQEQLELLADQVEQSVELEALVELAGEEGERSFSASDNHLKNQERDSEGAGPVIAVACDAAFCFFYQDNLELLKELGAKLAFFSPLTDSVLPEGTAGLYLPGGYPELYAQRLGENTSLLQAVKAAVKGGMPCIAECGGFLYLHDKLEGSDGVCYPAAGVFPGTAYRTTKLQRFGYVELTAKKDSMLLKAGETLRSHEFHYWESPDPGTDYHAEKASRTKGWDCVHAGSNLYAGFPHLYFYSRPETAERFVAACSAYKDARSQTEPVHTVRELQALCQNIKPLPEELLSASRRHWDGIAKPLKGLGRLEELITKIAGIQGMEQVDLSKKAVVILCSDNGIVAEHVTQSDSSVTAIVTENFARGTASVCRMAQTCGAAVIPVDVGVASDLTEPGVRNRKVAYGTKNFAKEPAMSEQELLSAIFTGIDLVRECREQDYRILATGEMGIGNTTTSSAVASVLLDVPVQLVTGRGAGLSKAGVAHKVQVIEDAIRLHHPDPSQPLEILRTLGGFDLAGLMGVFLGGALYHMPVILDGVISMTAALLAARFCPESRSCMLPSHMGKEPCCAIGMKELGLEPVIYGELALGEGTGAVLLFPMLDMANQVYLENSTFEDIHIEAYHPFEG